MRAGLVIARPQSSPDVSHYPFVVRVNHPCSACGTELGRLRAQREPHYGLNIVTCPTCTRVTVRRAHPLRTFTNWAFRLDAAVLAIGLQVGAAFLLLGITGVAIAEIGNEVYRWRRGPGLDGSFVFGKDAIAPLFFLATICLAIGAWTRSGLRHWPRLASISFVAFWMLLPAVWGPIVEPSLPNVIQGPQISYQVHGLAGPEVVTNRRSVNVEQLIGRLFVAIPCLLLVVAGTPLGRIVIWLATFGRRLRWRWRRRRARLRRHRS